jgi:hypothetical protein
MSSWERLAPATIQRRLTITNNGTMTVALPFKREGGDIDNEIRDVSSNALIVDMKNAAHMWVRLNKGSAPEVENIVPAGTKLPPEPPARVDSSNPKRKHRFKKSMGVFAMLEGDLGPRLGRLELASGLHYIFNSFADLNDLFKDQEPDYLDKLPVIRKSGEKDLTNWDGTPVKEIEWEIVSWVDRPAGLPDELYSHETAPPASPQPTKSIEEEEEERRDSILYR